MTKEERAEFYENEMLKAIKKYNWMLWAHIDWAALPYSKRTAYDYNLHQLQTIKEEFETNRSAGRSYLLQKWLDSDNATLQIAAMKIIADEETYKKLNQQSVDHTTKGEKVQINPQSYLDFIKDQFQSLKEDE